MAETLSETIVEGKKVALSYGVDKKTINASAFPDATNAVDLLTNVPSIQVSVDGKISYREGGKFKVYINGIAVPNGEERLKTLDASQIEKIDIITNPSARYSSEGTAGIIRILLKKNRLEGYNIGITAQTNTFGERAFSYSVDKKGKRGGWYTAGNYRDNRYGNRQSQLENVLQTPLQIFENQQNENFKGRSIRPNLNFGFNYDLTDQDVIDFSVNYNPFSQKDDKKSTTQVIENQYDIHRKLLSSKAFEWQNENLFSFQMMGMNLDYSHFFNREKTHFLNIIASYDHFLGNNENIIKTILISNGLTETFGNFNSEENEVMTSTEINYELPLTETTSVEAGLSFETDHIPNVRYENGFFEGDQITQVLTSEPYHQQIKYEQHIYTGFLTFKSSLGRFEYKLGLRAERTLRDIAYHFTKSNNKFSDNYNGDFTNWFPSVHLLYSFSEESQLGLNYSRRINRPHYSTLIPVMVWDDKYTFSTGNSRLNPTYTNAYELNYKKSWGKDFISSEIFVRNQQALQSSVRTPYYDDIFLVRMDNIGSSWAIGNELMAGIDIRPWWNINASFSSFYYTENTEVNTIKTDFKQWRYNAKLNQSFKFPKDFSLRLNVAYQSPTKGFQYENEGVFLATTSLTKSWRENRWQVSASFWNFLDSYRQTTQSQGEQFLLRTHNIYRPYASFSVRYRFNRQR